MKERHHVNKGNLHAFRHYRERRGRVGLVPEVWGMIEGYLVWQCGGDPWDDLWGVGKACGVGEWEVSMSVISPHEEAKEDWLSFYLAQDPTLTQKVKGTWDEALHLLDALSLNSSPLTLHLDALHDAHRHACEAVYLTYDKSKTLFGLDLVFKSGTSKKIRKSPYNYALIVHGQHSSITVDGPEARQYSEAV